MGLISPAVLGFIGINTDSINPGLLFFAVFLEVGAGSSAEADLAAGGFNFRERSTP